MSPLKIEISIDDQQLRLIRDGQVIRRHPVSTSDKGTGFKEGSHRTPTGHFIIAAGIGEGCSPDTLFKGREIVGRWDGSPQDGDLILSRILWLDGIDPENANTRGRFIYLHGTNHTAELGRPASCGCVRMASEDIIELFDQVGVGTPVFIIPPTRPGPDLAFFDCDSTLSTIEGIDELARARGPEVFAEVEALTHAAMNGEVPIHEVFPRRMEIIRPDRELCDRIGELYVETLVPGCAEAIDSLRGRGWMPVILSGGFAPLIRPLARHLGIRHVEAVPLFFNEDGSYAGYDRDYPTTRNGGKPEIIREWKQALNPRRVIMTGDGISDLETEGEVDRFIGFGGVVARDAVRSRAGAWIERMSDLDSVTSLDTHDA